MTLQRPCAMFLVHFGVNLWTLNDELMSAYDLAAASHHTSLARFIDTAASQAFIDDWHAVMKLCRRAAENARRRLSARRQPAASQRHNVDHHVDHRLLNTSHGLATVNGNVLPDAPSSSSVASFPPSSSMFVQSPRQANGRLFSTSTASDTQSQNHAKSTDWHKRRRFWPRSTREHGDACEEPFKVASIARQLLLMSVDDDSVVHDAQWRVVREQHRLSSAESCYTTTDASRYTASSSHADSQFYCQPRVTDKASAGRTSKMTSDRTEGSTETTPASRTTKAMLATRKTEKAASRRLRQAASDTSETAAEKTSNCSNIYCDPADCIQRHPVMNHSEDVSTGVQSKRSPSEYGLPQTCDNVHNNDDDPLRHWLTNNGLAEYFSLLAMEKVDLEAVALLTDDDLVHLGVPLGPRRRLQRAAGQLQSSAMTTADSSASDNTYL